MTGMLASIRSVSEAQLLADLGIDVIDLKEPKAGALGALDPVVVKQIIRHVNGKALLSATVGDVAMDDPKLLSRIEKMAATGVDIVKLGLFAEQPSAYFINTIHQAVQQNIRLVIVLFAEYYRGVQSFEQLLNSGIAGLMLDTQAKRAGNLTTILTLTALHKFVIAVKTHHLLCGLAGALTAQDIPLLLPLQPDYLGFRGALCSCDRNGNLARNKVKKIRSTIPISARKHYSVDQYQQQELTHGTVA